MAGERMRAARIAWLAEQLLHLADELRARWEEDPKAGLLRCPVHRRPHLGDSLDLAASAVCPICAVAKQLRWLKKNEIGLEVRKRVG
jgi:hypothetical protein